MGSSGLHARHHLAEDARRFEGGRLRLLVTEHIQREREGAQHRQKMGEVQRRRGVCV